jgi:formylmethanofuran dehydrogenase subunit E
MSERDYIHIKDLPLYIDVNCYDCKRLCALSNTREMEGRHYCGSCAGDFHHGAAVTEFLNDWPDVAVMRL